MGLFRKKSHNKPSLIGRSGLENNQRSSNRPTSEVRRRPNSGGSPVFSYQARPNASAAERGQRENRSDVQKRAAASRFRLGLVPTYIAFSMITVAFLYACYLQADPKIIVLSRPGTVHRDTKAYQAQSKDIWQSSLFNRTKLTVSTGNIRRSIERAFSEIQVAQVELPLLGRRPTIILSPAHPALQLISTNGAFYVNQDGKVLAETADVIQNDLKEIALVRDETGISAEPGKNVFSGPQTAFLTGLFAQLRAQGLSVQSITLPAGAANEADVRLTDKPYTIKFSFDIEPRQAVGTYLATNEKLEADGVMPSEYIDVRVEEKAFYR